MSDLGGSFERECGIERERERAIEMEIEKWRGREI